MKDGEVSEALRTPQGYAFVTVTGKQDAYVPEARRGEGARARRRAEAEGGRGRRGRRRRRSRAELKSGDFDAAARRRASRSRPPSSIARGAPIGDAGVSPALEAAAFALPAGGVSDPVVTDNGAVVVKVLEQKASTPTRRSARRVRAELLNERRGVLQRLHDQGAERMQIDIKRGSAC